MPKLSKRKKQLKEIYNRKQEDTVGGENDGDAEEAEGNNEEESQEEVKQARQQTAASSSGTVRTSSRMSARQQQLQQQQQSQVQQHSHQTSQRTQSQRNSSTSAAVAAAAAAANQVSDKVSGDDKVWVQCNNCDKWRSLPSTVDPNTLPDIWTCDLNIYDYNRNTCDAPEENYNKEEEQQNVQLKAFLRLWVKKLKTNDRAESRLVPNSVTRNNRKRKLEVEWIQCCNPACRKWRSITRNIDTNVLLPRLQKNQHFGGNGLWFCTMNSWDDTTASCAAPQEPVWNCRWNLNA